MYLTVFECWPALQLGHSLYLAADVTLAGVIQVVTHRYLTRSARRPAVK